MAQSSAFFITEQYGDCAPETVSNCLTANGAEMQLVGLTKCLGLGALTPKEARCAVAEAAALDGSGSYSFRKWVGGMHMTVTVHRH
jgi:hypothetical protein